MTTSFRKVVRPGTIPTYGGARVSVYCRIEYDAGKDRLSISGVIGPTHGGNAVGGCGQISMEFKHRDAAADDARFGHLIEPSAFNFAPGWDAERWLDFLTAWDRWHLNDMRSACEHQRALGWAYDTHHDPDPDAPGYPHVGLPCPECSYRIGSEWLHETPPTDVLAWLGELPDADREPAWV